ncbi:MAG: glycosyltransferase family 4 protein [Armatimonadetes bacterium]|nr:glycosyltransferase family 4 protein [Armatimonadota bacterium]
MKVLFVHNSLRSFVRKDRDILASAHEVQELNFRRHPSSVREAIEGVRRADLVFGWFASLHTWIPALLARRFRKPFVVVAGGYDAVNMPEIGYGSMRGGLPKAVARSTLFMADRVLAVSDFNRREILTNTGLPGEKVQRIYLGFETVPEQPPDFKRRQVFTVGNINESNRTRKGHDMFVRIAASLPETPFILAGSWDKTAVYALQREADPNVSFPGFVSNEEIRRIFMESAVYLQPSAHEAFGCSVAEAMLYGCLPVVSDRGALPEVIGDTGLVFPFGNHEAALEAVRRALEDPQVCLSARKRVIEAFPLSNRKRELLQCVDPVGEAAH